MRIAIAGIEHETNTYCSGFTTARDFQVLRGDKLLSCAGQESHPGGAVDACHALHIEPAPVLHAFAQPSGIIERATYEDLKAELLDIMAAAAPVDGALLLLHGAGVVDGIADLEADLAGAVRDLLGPKVPIVATFDLHGNITQAMADHLNGLFACHQYPHVDLHERAAEGVGLLAQMIRERTRAQCTVVPMPLLLPTTTTFEGIGERVLAKLQALEKASGVVDVSWFHGFPYTDVAHVGSAITVTTFDGNGAAVAKQAARLLWNQREAFRVTSLSAEEAVQVAQAQDADALKGPVVIHETSDNCGGGGPGDGTHLLRAMLDKGLGADACFGFIVDAQVAKQAHQAGVGAEIEVRLGGKTDDLHGEPIAARAYVKALHDGRLIMQHMMKGARLHLGPLARLVIDEIDVVVGSRRSQTFDREPFLAVGIDVMRYRYVALKSSNHFRAGFQHLAGAIITADPPGLTTHQIEVFPRQSTTRRFWPLDEAAEFKS